MLALAKLYLTVDDLDACQQQCVTLLKMDPGNDSATVVCLQDILIRIHFVSSKFDFNFVFDQ